MSTTRFAALAAPLLLCCLPPQSVPAADSSPAESYLIHCEVWNAMEPELVRTIEDQSSSGAEAVLQSLQGTEGGAERLVRILSPVDVGSQARFSSELETPTTMITASGAGMVQESFAGYSSEGTTVSLACTPGPSADRVTTSLELQISHHQVDDVAESKPNIPPGRRSVQVRCEGTSASGELHMIQFQTSEPGTLVAFLRATSL